jgi:hypothetical protein
LQPWAATARVPPRGTGFNGAETEKHLVIYL